MNKLILWFVLIALAIGAGTFAWWWFDARWRPATLTRNQPEITKLLEGAGWVSPKLTGPKAYILVFRDCPDCIRYVEEELPRLIKAGVETRIIVIARPDLNGVEKSSAVERTTVAELWINRSWDLWQDWSAAAPGAWTAAALPAADGDIARTAVVEAGRKVVADLAPLLKANGLKVGDGQVRYPTIIWWTREGVMKGCVCEQPQTWGAVRKDLGA